MNSVGNQWEKTATESIAVDRKTVKENKKTTQTQQTQYGFARVTTVRSLGDVFTYFRRHSIDDNGGGYEGL
jgi:hypothetical protein